MQGLLRLTAIFLALAAIAFTPAESSAGRLWDCLFGPTPPSITTYSPPFLPVQAPPVVATPAVVAPAYCAPACTPLCPPLDTACTACTPCVPQTSYMPTVVYRALYPTAEITAYRPWRAWCAVPGYPITSYRPSQGTYETRLVLYSTYRAVSIPQAAYYLSPAPCVSCFPSAGEVIYSAPTSGCAPCETTAPAATNTPALPSEPSPSAPQTTPKTFQESNKPQATEQDLKPIPETKSQINSLPAPVLPDPNNRTAALPLRKIEGRVSERTTVVQPASYSSMPEDESWRPARN